METTRQPGSKGSAFIQRVGVGFVLLVILSGVVQIGVPLPVSIPLPHDAGPCDASVVLGGGVIAIYSWPNGWHKSQTKIGVALMPQFKLAGEFWFVGAAHHPLPRWYGPAKVDRTPAIGVLLWPFALYIAVRLYLYRRQAGAAAAGVEAGVDQV